jgi:hypothetical protein
MAKLASSKRVGRGSDQFMLRLPDGMRDAVARMAEDRRRSMNAEIISALVHHIVRYSPGTPLPVEAEVIEYLNEALADKIREGEFQRAVREMGQKLEFIAKELDQIVAESEATAKKPSKKKKNPPA